MGLGSIWLCSEWELRMVFEQKWSELPWSSATGRWPRSRQGKHSRGHYCGLYSVGSAQSCSMDSGEKHRGRARQPVCKAVLTSLQLPLSWSSSVTGMEIRASLAQHFLMCGWGISSADWDPSWNESKLYPESTAPGRSHYHPSYPGTRHLFCSVCVTLLW